jgi:predicted short-subunit dehydrogenase-like oxidoreductase (DUF2520 family)
MVAQVADAFGQIGFSREEALSAQLPFLRGTLDNLESRRLPGALIGPVRRGDPATVRRHLSALTGEALQTYRVLTPTAIRLAEEDGLDPETAGRLRELL